MSHDDDDDKPEGRQVCLRNLCGCALRIRISNALELENWTNITLFDGLRLAVIKHKFDIRLVLEVLCDVTGILYTARVRRAASSSAKKCRLIGYVTGFDNFLLQTGQAAPQSAKIAKVK